MEKPRVRQVSRRAPVQRFGSSERESLSSRRVREKSPTEITPSTIVLSEIPAEITQEFLYHLPIESLIEFCSTSPQFSKYCKDSNFWKLKADYVREKYQILRVLQDSIKHNVSLLAKIMLEKLPIEELDPRELTDVFLDIIRSGKLSLIRKMTETLKKEFPKIFIHLNGSKFRDSMSTFKEKLEKMRKLKLDEIIETVYKLFIVMGPSSRYDFFQILISFGGDRYLLDNLSRDNPKIFDDTLFQILRSFIQENDVDDFAEYWNEYSLHLNDLDSIRKKLIALDKYPYPYTEIIGETMQSKRIVHDLKKAFDKDDYDLFVDIWNEYGSAIDDRDMRGIASIFYRSPRFSKRATGYGNRYLKLVRENFFEKLVHDLLWLAEEDAYDEFSSNWKMNRYYFDKEDRDNLIKEFEANGVPEKYDELVISYRNVGD